MSVGDGSRQPLAGLRHEDQMDVIGHQAPGPAGNSPGTAMLSQQLDIQSVIVVTEEHRLPPIATLGNVVRHIRHDSAWKLCHGAIMAEAGKG